MKMSDVIMPLFFNHNDLEGVKSDYVKEESKMWLLPLLICECHYNIMPQTRRRGKTELGESNGY